LFFDFCVRFIEILIKRKRKEINIDKVKQGKGKLKNFGKKKGGGRGGEKRD